MNRRDFLHSTVWAGAAMLAIPARARAVEPFRRSGPPRLLLSLAAYSFRDFFKVDAPRRRLDLIQFIDYCADHGCAGTELTSYYFPEQIDQDYLLRLRRHAFLRGIAVSGTAVGNTFTVPQGERRDRELAGVKTWINRAAVLGAPHIRIFAGNLGSLSKDEAKRLCIQAIEECGEYAGKKGIMLGLENHGGIVAEPDDVIDIVQAVKSPWVGVNLDTGNFHTDDPYRDLARCAPYAVNVQVKSELRRRGQDRNEPADLARIIGLLREVNYQGYVALEYEAKEDPWMAVPRLLRQLKEMFERAA